MRPEGVVPDQPETGVSADATRPPGDAAGGDAAGAGAGEAAEAGAGVVQGPFTSFRLRSFNRGQLAGTCHGFSAQ